MVLCSRKVRLDIRYSGTQSSVGWLLVSEVWGLLIGRYFKGRESHLVPRLNFLELQIEIFIVVKYCLREYNDQPTGFIIKEYRFIPS